MEIKDNTIDNINKIIESEIGIPLELFNTLSDEVQKKIIENKYQKELKVKTYDYLEQTYLSDGTSTLAGTYVKEKRKELNKKFDRAFYNK